MRIEVNGEERDAADGSTVGDLLDTLVEDRRGVAVAVDGEVVPRSGWDETDLRDGARVEVVGAVQGG